MGVAVGAQTAVDTLRALQGDLTEEQKRNDWVSYLQDARQQEFFLNGSPAAALEVARALLKLNRPAAAWVEVHRILRMGQISAAFHVPMLRAYQRSINILEARNKKQISRAMTEFAVSDAELLPEDLDYDAKTKRFFVTSILQRNVTALDHAGHLKVFTETPEHWPTLAIRVDASRRWLWVTEVALTGFSGIKPSDVGRSTLLKYDLDRGTPLGRYEGPASSNWGDMALAPNGDPIISDGDGGGIYRLREGILQRIDHGDFISPQTPALCGRGGTAFIPDYVRGLASLNLSTGHVSWLSSRDRYTLDSIDGLYCRGRTLVAVQNGTSPERVMVFMLAPHGNAIISERVVERATPTLGVPTHGVFVGANFYFIANSGWDVLDEHGQLQSLKRFTPALIRRFDATH
jgi:hypothetical protein